MLLLSSCLYTQTEVCDLKTPPRHLFDFHKSCWKVLGDKIPIFKQPLPHCVQHQSGSLQLSPQTLCLAHQKRSSHLPRVPPSVPRGPSKPAVPMAAPFPDGLPGKSTEHIPPPPQSLPHALRISQPEGKDDLKPLSENGVLCQGKADLRG